MRGIVTVTPRQLEQERRRFEDYMRREQHCGDAHLRRHGDVYAMYHTQCCWNVWQARAQLNPPAESP